MDDADVRFERLVARYRDTVFRVVLSVLGPEHAPEAEDVTQEVFLRVHGALRSFRGESDLRTWLYRIALRAAIDARRRARHRFAHVQLQELPTTYACDDAAMDLRRCLERLPDRQRSVLQLHYWMGLSVSEIATMFGNREGTIKASLHRGRQRIAHMLERKER